MDDLDNCCVALIVLGAVVECVSKCFVPAYVKEEESKNNNDIINENNKSQSPYKSDTQKMK